MSLPIRVRRGLEAARAGVTPAAGELLYVTDTDLVYIGDGTTAGGVLVSGSGPTVTLQSAVPSTPAAGDLWYQTDDGVLYIYYTDADTSQWVPATVTGPPPGTTIQRVDAPIHTAYGSGTALFSFDDTLPQNTEGTDSIGSVTLPTVTITPTLTTNRLVIHAHIPMFNGNAGTQALGGFIVQDSGADAIATVVAHVTPGQIQAIDIFHEMEAGTISATTFKIRVAGSAVTYGCNGSSSNALFGASYGTRLSVMEFQT